MLHQWWKISCWSIISIYTIASKQISREMAPDGLNMDDLDSSSALSLRIGVIDIACRPDFYRSFRFGEPVPLHRTFFPISLHSKRHNGKRSRNRICDVWFWRPLLYQLSYPLVNRNALGHHLRHPWRRFPYPQADSNPLKNGLYSHRIP